MQTSYEILVAAKGIISRKPEAFKKFIELTANDVFFQTKFIVCDDTKTNEEMVNFYRYVKKNLFLLENINDLSSWVNEALVEKTNDWLSKNRRDMFDAEKRHAYEVKSSADIFTSGIELEDADFTKILAGFICNLPEIHRITALAFYYDDCDINKMSEIMNIDITTIKCRVEYIEKTLTTQMKQYCKDNGFVGHSAKPQRIRTALIELSKMYSYPYAEQLYDVVVS